MTFLFEHVNNSPRTDHQWNKEEDARQKLRDILGTWYHKLGQLLSSEAIAALTASTPEGHPLEQTKLGFPSDFDTQDHVELGLEDLAIIERELRIGLAHDTLKKIWTLLGLKSFLVGKRHRVQGYTISTRAETEIRNVDRQVKKWFGIYNHNWTALEVLRGSAEIPSENRPWTQLQQLRRTDCIMLYDWMEEHAVWRGRGERALIEATQRGEGPKPLPWIWKIEFDFEGEAANSVEGAVQGWTDEGKWCHLKALSTMI